jgi:hypothetical protein
MNMMKSGQWLSHSRPFWPPAPRAARPRPGGKPGSVRRLICAGDMHAGSHGDRPRVAPLRLVKGEASILSTWNNSQSPYSFAAPDFFAAIAPRKLVHEGRRRNLPIVCGLGGTVVQRVPGIVSETSLASGPTIKSTDVEPGEVSDLQFVPLEEGRYSVECRVVAEVTGTTATMISVVAK